MRYTSGALGAGNAFIDVLWQKSPDFPYAGYAATCTKCTGANFFPGTTEKSQPNPREEEQS